MALKVCHLTPSTFVAGSMGGGERYVQQLSSAQASIGIGQLIISAPGFNELSIADGEFQNRLALGKALELIADSDIVHAHQLNHGTFNVAALAAKRLNKPLVLTDHGGFSLTVARLLGRSRLRLVNGFAPVSPWSKTDIDPANSIVNHQIIWGGGDHLPAGRITEALASDFSFVGRLLPHKGLHVVIEALPDNATLRVVGEVRDMEYMSHLRSLAKGKKVFFEGSLGEQGLADAYASTKATVLPSVERFRSKKFARPELLGIVVLESLFAGKPAIGSSVGGLLDLLERTAQTSVAPGDVELWNKALHKSSNHPQSAININGLRWVDAADRTLQLYERLAG